jgi:hypothetical protein
MKLLQFADFRLEMRLTWSEALARKAIVAVAIVVPEVVITVRIPRLCNDRHGDVSIMLFMVKLGYALPLASDVRSLYAYFCTYACRADNFKF